MGIDKERLDRVIIDSEGDRWGEFEVGDIELLHIPTARIKYEVYKAADRLGLDWKKLQIFRHPSKCVQIVRGPLKPEAPPAADYVSNRRHIDLSILE